jgi:hypothetical protein
MNYICFINYDSQIKLTKLLLGRRALMLSCEWKMKWKGRREHREWKEEQRDKGK